MIMIQYIEAYNTAKSFVKTFEIIDALTLEEKTELAIPLVVNGSFACELLFKSFLPAGVRGHKLYDDIFIILENYNKRLSIEITNNVIEMQTLLLGGKKNYTAEKFKQDLIIAQDDFELYRYAHEKGRIPNKRVCDVSFLRILISTLMKMIEAEPN
jgi:hypothetical protein